MVSHSKEGWRILNYHLLGALKTCIFTSVKAETFSIFHIVKKYVTAQVQPKEAAVGAEALIQHQLTASTTAQKWKKWKYNHLQHPSTMWWVTLSVLWFTYEILTQKAFFFSLNNQTQSLLCYSVKLGRLKSHFRAIKFIWHLLGRREAR